MCTVRISSLLGKITALLIICCCSFSAKAKYGGGTGEPNDPYLIYTPEQMNEIGLNEEDWGKHFKLKADIDLSGYTGTSFNIIGTSSPYLPFSGVFDGTGHTISNFTYTSTGTEFFGIFGYVYGSHAEIKNVGLIDPEVDVEEGDNVGSLVGFLQGGTITNCYVEGGSVLGHWYIGGLVGENAGAITTCYSTGSVEGDSSVGGIVGYNGGIITNCYSIASTSDSHKWYGDVGGLVGENEGDVSNCYSSGSASGFFNVGGLVGNNYHGSVKNCLSSGIVSGTGSDVGGLVGYGEGVVNSFWDIETSGQTKSAGGTGLTTADLQMASTFIVWWCDSAWTIDEGFDYPRLAWENKPGELITVPSDLYGGGTGEPNNPYLIYTAQQLINISLVPCHWDKHFKLLSDIDLSSYSGTSSYIIKDFKGVFDGNGFEILNYNLNSAVFLWVSSNRAEIKNLGLRFTSSPLVQKLSSGAKITNCYVEDSSVTGINITKNVGGLVGENDEGTITDCHSSANVSGNENVGGLVGWNHDGGIITNCYSTGSVVGDKVVGGLVGSNRDNGEITNSYATGSVEGDSSVGGLVGSNWSSTITNSYSSSNVLGDSSVGGFIGIITYFSEITNCYSVGSVSGTGNYVGGLVGRRFSGPVPTASFWDIETSGQLTSAGGTGKTTVQMQTVMTFLAWACSDPVWTIDEGVNYPRLLWENKPGELMTIPSDLYGGGSGEPNDPYLIYTAERLNTIGLVPCHLDKHFLLCADIDLSSYTGNSFNIIGDDYYDNRFTGVFDGNGHTISNFTYTTAERYIGLFGSVGAAQIKNLKLIDPNVDAGTSDGVGSLVGYVSSTSTITNCCVEGGIVTGGDSVGGLVGIYRGTIYNCSSTGSFSGDKGVGGLIGNNYGSITNCYSTGSISGNESVGGLAGKNDGAIVVSCSSADISGHRLVGGLAGYNKADITDSYSMCSVSGLDYIGGLVGYNYDDGAITTCYSNGDVSGINYVGGLAGYDESNEIANSFWDIETSRQDISAGGTGLPTDQMQMQSTFTDDGWDFVGETVNGIEDIWFIPQQDYPHLWWEGMQVPMKLTPRRLNCRSKGNYVKAHIILPEGFTVEDVDPDKLAVLHSYGFQSTPLYVFVNKDKLVEIEAAFEREAVCSLTGNWPQDLTVAGFLADGNIFLGTSNIRIIHPGMKVIEDLATYWLNTDCVHPDFCDGIDMNRDSLVNLLDYALLMNTKVEFVTDE